MKIVWYSSPGRYADNPRALHQRLRQRRGDADEHVWLASPAHAGTFPAGTATVPMDTPEAVAALGSADLVVADNHLPVWVKRPGATYVQTWHGTPLKRIHRDALSAEPGSEAVGLVLDDDVTRWDLLLSQSRAATAPLRGAFRFDGRVEVTGYPRNDALVAPDAVLRRERVRAALGLPEESTAVLYAPTWRDDDRFGAGPDFRLALDLERFRERLGPDHVLLLRLHPFVAGALAGVDLPAGVVDVSRHPDVNDLCLAADVLVTDYSSVVFDFALTGKPVIAFVHDLDHYRDVVRGFYFDPEDTFPGPVLRDAEDVLDALADLEEVATAYKAEYQAFVQRFCHADDGGAADRVLDLVLAEEVSPAAPR